MNFAKKWRKALFNLRFNTPWFLHSIFKTRNFGFSGTTPEPLQTSTKHRFLFRQITFDHHWPTVILYVEDWQSSRQIDVIILKLFQKYLHTHYYLVVDIRIRRYISISIHTLQYFPKKTLAYFCVSQSGYVKVKHVYCFCFWQLTASFLVVFAPHTEIYYGDLLENKIGLAIMAAILLLWKYYLHILQVCLSSSK